MSFRFFLFACVLFLGCKKNTDQSQPPNPTPTPQPAETIKGILVSTREIVGGSLITYLTMYNQDGSVIWKITGNDNGGTPTPAYSNNTVYFPVSTFDPVTTNSYNTLYVRNINNGNLVSQYRSPALIMSTPVVMNDTAYMACYNGIYAFKRGGGQAWSKAISNLQPYPVTADGKTLYVISAPLSTAFYSLHAFDITTKTIIWTYSLGYNPPQGILISDDKLFLTNGANRLIALNKNTGSQLWIKNDQQYAEHTLDNNTIYSFNHQSPLQVYAFGKNNGNKLWQTAGGPIADLSNIYLYNNKLYFMAGYYSNKQYMHCINPSTGAVLWQKEIDATTSLTKQVITDKDAFYLRTNTNDNYTRVIRYDAESFTAKDSFNVQVAEFGQPRIIMTNGKVY